jgi:transposase InsO family protein
VVPAPGRKVYEEAVTETLVILWEAADRICGKRLKAIIQPLIEAMERHGHLALAPELRAKLLRVSASTIDRHLKPKRARASRRRTLRTKSKPSQLVPIRTFGDWSGSPPGRLEIDFVVHCGGTMLGSYIHSLVATDVCSGWTESIPLLVREQSLVTNGLDVLGNQFPMAITGINSDNDSAFINDTLIDYCKERGIEFTRSRPYRKNDQAWIEQKNGSIIRRFVGHARFAGPVMAQTLAQLYQALRLYVNYFQPSFKLIEKDRIGGRVRKTYDTPATPCDRLIANQRIDALARRRLQEERSRLDPVELLFRIRQAQAALAALSSPERRDAPGRESLKSFLAALPYLWQDGEIRPTHQKRDSKPHNWRTRVDPFEGVWTEVLGWLQEEPDATAKAFFYRLQEKYPRRYSRGQLRTLQRRVRGWRSMMARELVYACLEDKPPESVHFVGAKSP